MPYCPCRSKNHLGKANCPHGKWFLTTGQQVRIMVYVSKWNWWHGFNHRKADRVQKGTNIYIYTHRSCTHHMKCIYNDRRNENKWPDWESSPKPSAIYRRTYLANWRRNSTRHTIYNMRRWSNKIMACVWLKWPGTWKEIL